MEKIVSQFLKQINVPVSGKYVEQLILSHPDFPSLLSISDVFSRLGINHIVTRIEKEKMHELEFPCLAPLDKGRGDILLLKNPGSLTKYREHLNNEWGGAILLAEPTPNIADKQNNDLFSKENKIKKLSASLIIALSAILLASIFFSFSWTTLLLLSLSLCGTVVGYFLVAKELGLNYAAVDAFCNSGKASNCDKILKSEVSLLGISFSEAALAYFLFQAIALGFAPFTGTTTTLLILSILSFAALPVVAFSIYYQFSVAKVWCRLCLIVDAILLAQAYVFVYSWLSGPFTASSINLLQLAGLALGGWAIFAGIAIVKSSVERYETLNRQGGTGNRVKHNAEVFLSLLQKQKKVDASPFEHEMMLGNPNAPIKIIMVSNLYCNPCKAKHEVVSQLVAMYPDKVNVALRFVKARKDPASVAHLINYWHEHIHKSDNEPRKTEQLLMNWFAMQDIQKFMMKYPANKTSSSGPTLEVRHYNWVAEATVNKTPTFFINGYELPMEYAIDDLMVMTPAIAGNMNVQAKINLEMQKV